MTFNPYLHRSTHKGEIKRSCWVLIANLITAILFGGFLIALLYMFINDDWGNFVNTAAMFLVYGLCTVLVVAFVVAQVVQYLWANGVVWSFQWRILGWALIAVAVFGIVIVLVYVGDHHLIHRFAYGK